MRRSNITALLFSGLLVGCPTEGVCAAPPASPMLVRGFDMQLHAAVTVDGQVRLHFKKPNRLGATCAQMTPDAFLVRRRRPAVSRQPSATTAADA